MDKYLKKQQRQFEEQLSREPDSTGENSANPPPTKKLRTGEPVIQGPCRKYNDAYLKFVFIATDKSSPRPQCVICNEILAVANMKPSKLMRHQATKHKDFVGKQQQFFDRSRLELLKQKSAFKKLAMTNAEGFLPGCSAHC